MRVLGVSATARASAYLYNSHDEIDVLVRALASARAAFGVRSGGAAVGGLDDLYQELILDHYRRKRGEGSLESPSPWPSTRTTRSAATRSTSSWASTTAGSWSSRTRGRAARSRRRRPR